MSRNRTKVATIAFALMLTMAATFMVFLPVVSAAEYPTYAFLSVAPNPVGVGQTVTVTFWLNVVPPTAGLVGWGDRWQGFTVTVTKPGGTTQTLGPYKSDPVGSGWASFVPDTVGTYQFQFSFPGQNITFIGTDYYKPSTSSIVSLTVQQAAIEPWPEVPLPTDYWQRPIEAENRDWWSISGNWLMGGYNSSAKFNPYTKAPNTAHIVWKKPIAFGGIVGGEFGTTAYYTGQTYENKWGTQIIMNGILYYNVPDYPNYGFFAVDLRTGEQLWWHNSTGQPSLGSPFGNPLTTTYPLLTLGQLYDYESPNQHGVIPYLWSISGASPTAVYQMYDAFTGNLILSLVNGSTGTTVYSPKGDLLVYILDGFGNWLAMWNSSRVSGMLAGTTSTNAWMWRPPVGATLDWRTGIQWNVSVPDVAGEQGIATPGIGWSDISPDLMLATTGNIVFATAGWQLEIAYNLKTGQQLWVQNRTLTPGTTAFGVIGPMLDGVFMRYTKETKSWRAYDAYTGSLLWGPTEPRASAWGMYSEVSAIAYGKFYATAYDGMVYCYDLKTGQHLWDYSSGNSGLETPYGGWPFFGGNGFAIADGKLYLPTGEHSPTNPLWKGERLHCVNAETGKGVWSILGWFQNPAIADGYMVTLNGYDNQIYCFGKGKTVTTVSVPQTTVANGSSVLIQGTILDQSPSQPGTPCVSAKSQEQWMEYLHMQKPCPANTTGVPVKLEAFGADGSVTTIGTVTSDAYGNFKSPWTPTKTGLYTIMATFAGDDSYWSSYAATGLNVGPAPVPIEIPPVEIPAYPDYTPMLAAILVVGIIVAILVVYSIFRKRQ